MIEPTTPKSTLCGFILTRQRREHAGNTTCEYWLATDDGPVKITTDVQQELFFIQQSNVTVSQKLLQSQKIPHTIKELPLKTFEQTPVAGLYFQRSQELYQARELLTSNEITCYEDDIHVCERFLMERFIYGSLAFIGQLSSNARSRYRSYHQTYVKPFHYSPKLRALSLDIECSEHGELYSIGLAAKGYRRVLMIGDAQKHTETDCPNWIVWLANEKTLLESFIQHVQDFDPDIFIGWAVVNFDFRLLFKRAERHGLKLKIGRNHEQAHWRDARNEHNQGYVSMAGRVVIDGIDALKTATYHFDSFSLENVSQALLGKGKLSDDVHNRMDEINHDFKHNKIKLAKYNLQDCELVLDIFDHTQVLEFLILRSQLTGLELDRSGGSVAAFLNLYLPKLHRAGYVSPVRPEDGGLASPGGYVMESRPGLYKNVLVLDFKSLYPSIIRTFKIDPLGLTEGLQNPEDAIPGYKGAVFSRDKHFLPEIITSLWQQRDEAKRNSDQTRSQAIKILMNSFYGVLGSGGCPFYDTRLASSITMRGHDIMKTTAKWIENAGFTVIYGDTDSTFVWLNGDYTATEARSIGQTLQNDINIKWNTKIDKEFNLKSDLDIEFETHFSQFLMPTIRGSSVGSKKRYAGLIQKESGEELIFKGLETVRSDWTPLAKIFQHTLYSMVFAGQDVNTYIKTLIADTYAGKHDSDLVYRKRLRRALDHYIKNVPPHVKAARAADSRNKALGRPQQYQHKGHIEYVITLNGPEAVEHQVSPLDYEHYVERQIRPIAEGILPFIDLSFDKITSAQLGLF
ncbi:MAG: DNA polymerase-2 [Flavobacteriales bacterium]|jgi:DNA polymerase-2